MTPGQRRERDQDETVRQEEIDCRVRGERRPKVRCEQRHAAPAQSSTVRQHAHIARTVFANNGSPLYLAKRLVEGRFPTPKSTSGGRHDRPPWPIPRAGTRRRGGGVENGVFRLSNRKYTGNCPRQQVSGRFGRSAGQRPSRSGSRSRRASTQLRQRGCGPGIPHLGYVFGAMPSSGRFSTSAVRWPSRSVRVPQRVFESLGSQAGGTALNLR